MPQTGFLTDTDTYVLSCRVLRLGMIWQWRANKGLAYAEDMGNYEDALSIAIGNDKGSNIIRVGGLRGGSRLGIAYPGTLG